MKTRIFYFVGVSCLLISAVSTAQQISQDILLHFNSSVVSRVYEVTSRLAIAPKEQKELALAYQREDSVVLDKIKSGGSVSDINFVRRGSIIAYYDSLMELSRIRQQKIDFIIKKTKELNQIKNLTKEQADGLFAKFIAKYNADGLTNNNLLKQVLPEVLKDTLYYSVLYAPEINIKASMATKQFPSSCKMPNAILSICQDLVYQYQKALITVAYAYPKANSESENLVGEIQKYYQPLIDSQLARHGYLSLSTQFAIALKYKDYLKLTESQRAELINKNAELSKVAKEYNLANSGKTYAASSFIRKAMRSLLDEKQYRNVLQLRYQKQAEKQLKPVWETLKQNNKYSESDSSKVCHLLYAYFIDQLVVKEMYSDDSDKTIIELKRIDTFKPECMKQYYQIRREARLKKEAAKYGGNTNLIW